MRDLANDLDVVIARGAWNVYFPYPGKLAPPSRAVKIIELPGAVNAQIFWVNSRYLWSHPIASPEDQRKRDAIAQHPVSSRFYLPGASGAERTPYGCRLSAGAGISRSISAELNDFPCASSASERVTPPPSASRRTKFIAPISGIS
jgi:hypothetical protein